MGSVDSNHINLLQRHFIRLTEIAEDTLIARVYYDPDDDQEIMLLGYLCRQLEHAKSITALVQLQCSSDAPIIARMMTEGLAQLLWAYNHQPEGPKLWLNYTHIEEWRRYKFAESNGETINESAQVENARVVTATQDTYYDRKAKTKQKTGKNPSSDPYRTQWNSIGAADTFTAVGGKALYDDIYRRASDRIHWNPSSILSSLIIEEHGEARLYMANDIVAAATALAVGFQCLWQTLEVVDNHFRLRRRGRLFKVYDSYRIEIGDALARVGIIV